MPPTLRLAILDDAEQIRAIYAPYCLTPISFEAEPPSVEEMRGRLAEASDFACRGIISPQQYNPVAST